LVVGIDVGTTHVRVIVGEPQHDKTVNIVGVGINSSEGLKKGVIVDLDATVQSITRAVEEAERMVGYDIEEAFVALTGLDVDLIPNKGIVAVTSEDREITRDDVERVIHAAQVIALPSDREIVEVMPREFIVDGYDGIKDPVGMLGVRLEVDALIITSSITSLRNLIRCVNRAGIEVKGLVLQSLANSEVALSKDEKELGVFLIDLGGGKSELSLFQNGTLQKLSVLPIGGNHITNDLAVGLRTSFKMAENLKLEYGCALSAMADPNTFIGVTEVGGKQSRQVSQRELSSFLEPRVQEILQISKEEIQKMGWDKMPPAGIVLTGGVSIMEGLTEMAEKIYDVSVRVAEPSFVGVQSPIYTTAVGTAYYAQQYAREAKVEKKEVRKKGFIKKLWERTLAWFNDIFE